MKTNAIQLRRRLRLPAAFTLVELLIVLAIIGIVTALGIPLFGVLTGAKSVEAGRNLVAATLGQARTVAVNEGKYAGVMFFVDPATERTAMSIVIVTDPASSMEDPDPYDKYKGWQADQTYYSGKVDNNQSFAERADRTIRIAVDADATYRGSLYAQSPAVSNYLNMFGNYRPTVKTYRCLTTHENAEDKNGSRPPRNGPYADPTASTIYSRPGGGGGAFPRALESTVGPFSNDLWGNDDQTAVTRYSTGEMTLLPRGIGAQVIIQSTSAQLTPTLRVTDRYMRMAVVMFDPQGRLVLRDFSLSSTDTLGQYLQLRASTTAQHIVSGIGLALYETEAFKTAGFSESDSIYATAAYKVEAPTNAALMDGVMGSPTAPAVAAEAQEETWLDTNGKPLLINRYTGSLSEAD